MTTPDQLLADQKWRRRHSVYTLWALFLGFGFVALVYTGVRAKRSNWTAAGAIYGGIVIGLVAISESLSPEDSDAATTLVADLAYIALIIVWVVSTIHVFAARKEWLRWKAAQAGQPQWYEAPVTKRSTSGADLSGLGIDDTTGEYLAGAAPAPPPQPATQSPTLPSPPVTQPSRPSRNLSPPPTAPAEPLIPPAASESAAHPRASEALVDLNTASVETIAELPGVGVATAKRIVDERKRRGGFESVDEAAIAVEVQPHVRSRLHKHCVVSERGAQQPRRGSGRIVDI